MYFSGEMCIINDPNEENSVRVLRKTNFTLFWPGFLQVLKGDEEAKKSFHNTSHKYWLTHWRKIDIIQFKITSSYVPDPEMLIR